MVHGPEPAALQNNAAVEPLCQALEHDSGHRVATVNLPEAGRTAPVDVDVVVVEGPDAVPGRVEDVASDDSEGEAEDEVEAVLFDGAHVAVGEQL
jgi:hypothetical protein